MGTIVHVCSIIVGVQQLAIKNICIFEMSQIADLFQAPRTVYLFSRALETDFTFSFSSLLLRVR